MHFNIRQYLNQLAQANAGNPLGYLWEFAPVHSWWHMERMSDTQPAGFLTFHRLVIRSLRQTFPGGMIPVQASSLLPFPTPLESQAAAVRDITVMQEFSADLEAWHNGVHNTIGGRFGDPERNIYLRSFWEFHIFLDTQFARALTAMDMSWSRYLSGVSETDQRLI